MPRRRKLSPRSYLALGMTNQKFIRRFMLIWEIMNVGPRTMLSKYGLREKLRTRCLSDGLFPRMWDADELVHAMGMTREIFCGSEAEFIIHLRRRRAWELGLNIDTSTRQRWGEPSVVLPKLKNRKRE